MGNEFAVCSVGQADFEHSETLPEFQEMRHGIDRSGRWLAQEIDVQAGRHRQGNRTNMGEYGGIGGYVG